MKLAVINYDLNGKTFKHSRTLVEVGECRWVLGKLATLRLVPASYLTADDEIFVVETEPGIFVPEGAL